MKCNMDDLDDILVKHLNTWWWDMEWFLHLSLNGHMNYMNETVNLEARRHPSANTLKRRSYKQTTESALRHCKSHTWYNIIVRSNDVILAQVLILVVGWKFWSILLLSMSSNKFVDKRCVNVRFTFECRSMNRKFVIHWNAPTIIMKYC